MAAWCVSIQVGPESQAWPLAARRDESFVVGGRRKRTRMLGQLLQAGVGFGG
jgi:hypothetical protein